jgi:hypothetical protein
MHPTSRFCSLDHALKYIWVATAALILSGCVALQKVTSSAEAPKATVGYVAGVFSAAAADDFGLGITRVGGGDEVVLPFANLATPMKVVMQDRVTMIELPPGKYRISSWLTFGRYTKEKVTRNELPAGVEALEFTVAPGRVRYLGKFAAASAVAGYLKIRFSIRPQTIAQQDLALLFEVGYPNFPLELVDRQPGSVY